jgi:hypothetical protein
MISPLENLEALLLVAVAMQRPGAAARLHDRLGAQQLAGSGRLDVDHAVDAEPIGVDRVERFEQKRRRGSRGHSHGGRCVGRRGASAGRPLRNFRKG